MASIFDSPGLINALRAAQAQGLLGETLADTPPVQQQPASVWDAIADVNDRYNSALADAKEANPDWYQKPDVSRFSKRKADAVLGQWDERVFEGAPDQLEYQSEIAKILNDYGYMSADDLRQSVRGSHNDLYPNLGIGNSLYENKALGFEPHGGSARDVNLDAYTPELGIGDYAFREQGENELALNSPVLGALAALATPVAGPWAMAALKGLQAAQGQTLKTQDYLDLASSSTGYLGDGLFKDIADSALGSIPVDEGSSGSRNPEAELEKEFEGSITDWDDWLKTINTEWGNWDWKPPDPNVPTEGAGGGGGGGSESDAPSAPSAPPEYIPGPEAPPEGTQVDPNHATREDEVWRHTNPDGTVVAGNEMGEVWEVEPEPEGPGGEGEDEFDIVFGPGNILGDPDLEGDGDVGSDPTDAGDGGDYPSDTPDDTGDEGDDELTFGGIKKGDTIGDGDGPGDEGTGGDDNGNDPNNTPITNEVLGGAAGTTEPELLDLFAISQYRMLPPQQRLYALQRLQAKIRARQA